MKQLTQFLRLSTKMQQSLHRKERFLHSNHLLLDDDTNALTFLKETSTCALSDVLSATKLLTATFDLLYT